MTIPLRIHRKAQPLSCYRNVKEMIGRSGGSIQYGWLVLQNGLLIEAEHHAVWVNKQQEFIDITPRPHPMATVVFIPDDRLLYTGTPIDNIRLNKTDSPLVDDLIAITEMIERIVTNADRISDMKVRFNPEQAVADQRYREVGEQLVYYITSGRTEDDWCFCSSGKPYKACHATAIHEMIIADKARFAQQLIVFQPTVND